MSQNDIFAPVPHVAVAWRVTRYDNSGAWLDTTLHLREPDIQSTARTEVEPLYSSPPPQAQPLADIVKAFLSAHDEHGPGLIDCVDNNGQRYTSQFLADTIAKARAALATTEGSAE